MSQHKPSFQAGFQRFFRKRELYLRSDGHIHYLALEPFMLMSMAGLVVTLLSVGIIGGAWYFMAGNTVIMLRENLNRNITVEAFNSEKAPADYQNQQGKLNNPSAAELKTQRKKYEARIEKLRDAYELQLAQFQSSLAQVNGRMAKNQNAYLKELERLRLVKAAQKPEENVPAKN